MSDKCFRGVQQFDVRLDQLEVVSGLNTRQGAIVDSIQLEFRIIGIAKSNGFRHITAAMKPMNASELNVIAQKAARYTAKVIGTTNVIALLF